MKKEQVQSENREQDHWSDPDLRFSQEQVNFQKRMIQHEIDRLEKMLQIAKEECAGPFIQRIEESLNEFRDLLQDISIDIVPRVWLDRNREAWSRRNILKEDLPSGF